MLLVLFKLTRNFPSPAGSAVASDKALQLTLESGFRVFSFVGKLEAQVVIGGGRDNLEAGTDKPQ